MSHQENLGELSGVTTIQCNSKAEYLRRFISNCQDFKKNKYKNSVVDQLMITDFNLFLCTVTNSEENIPSILMHLVP